MRRAIVGSRIIALGYDNAADLDKLYALAKQQKADETPAEAEGQGAQEESSIDQDEPAAENEGAMY